MDMPKPTRLKLIDERPAVPLREEDAAAASPVPPAARVVATDEAEAIIRQLRADADAANLRVHDVEVAAKAKVDEAAQTVEALAVQAKERISEVERERDAALTVAHSRVEERKQATAVATAVSLGLLQKITAECSKIAVWLPSLGALFGGWWLFNGSVSQPSPQTLMELGLYGLVVVLPASILTLKVRA